MNRVFSLRNLPPIQAEVLSYQGAADYELLSRMETELSSYDDEVRAGDIIVASKIDVREAVKITSLGANLLLARFKIDEDLDAAERHRLISGIIYAAEFYNPKRHSNEVAPTNIGLEDFDRVSVELTHFDVTTEETDNLVVKGKVYVQPKLSLHHRMLLRLREQKHSYLRGMMALSISEENLAKDDLVVLGKCDVRYAKAITDTGATLVVPNYRVLPQENSQEFNRLKAGLVQNQSWYKPSRESRTKEPVAITRSDYDQIDVQIRSYNVTFPKVSSVLNSRPKPKSSKKKS